MRFRDECALMTYFSFAKSLINFIFNSFQSTKNAQIKADIRVKVMGHIMITHRGYFLKFKSSSILEMIIQKARSIPIER